MGLVVASVLFQQLIIIIPIKEKYGIHLRLINKLAEKVVELEGVHSSINDIFSSGAVEGYSDEKLDVLVLGKTAIETMDSKHLLSCNCDSGSWFCFVYLRQEKSLMGMYKKAMKA